MTYIYIYIHHILYIHIPPQSNAVCIWVYTDTYIHITALPSPASNLQELAHLVTVMRSASDEYTLCYIEIYEIHIQHVYIGIHDIYIYIIYIYTCINMSSFSNIFKKLILFVIRLHLYIHITYSAPNHATRLRFLHLLQGCDGNGWNRRWERGRGAWPGRWSLKW